MQYRPLGRTGLQVSRIGFGSGPIGSLGSLSQEEGASAVLRVQASDAIREAVARGINFFETAPDYGSGRAERRLGEALEDQAGGVIMATQFAFREGRTAQEYTDGLRTSLDNLRTGHVDILQLQGGTFDDATACGILQSGVLEWADEMRSEGFCRYLGIAAGEPSDALGHLLHSGRFDTLLIAHEVILRGVGDYPDPPAGIIPLARSLGMGILALRPATGGFLPELLRRESPQLDEAGLTRLAINLALSTPEVDCAVVGMRSMEEVQAAVALVEAAALKKRRLSPPTSAN